MEDAAGKYIFMTLPNHFDHAGLSLLATSLDNGTSGVLIYLQVCWVSCAASSSHANKDVISVPIRLDPDPQISQFALGEIWTVPHSMSIVCVAC